MSERAIIYQNSPVGLTPERLSSGFFEGWPRRPSPEVHLRLLRESSHVVVAIDPGADGEPVIGFITAITDRTLFAFVPLLEVLPAYRGRGIGRELVERLLARLEGLYAVDLVCDAWMQPFYEGLGLRSLCAMSRRDFRFQAGPGSDF